MIDVIKHEAEIARFVYRRRQGLSRLDKTKPRGELARPEGRLMEALPFAGATIEGVEMLALIVGRIGLGRQFEARGDDLGDVGEHG